MIKANSTTDELESQSQSSKPARMRKGGRFTRFLRGAGWTLAGLVALVIALVIFGKVIPPFHSPRVFLLSKENFGLGFSPGDPWNPDEFEAAMKANGIDVIRDNSTDSVTDKQFWAVWQTSNWRIAIFANSDTKAPNATLENITIFSRGSNTDEKRTAEYKASDAYRDEMNLIAKAEQMFTDKDERTEWIGKEKSISAWQYVPQVESSAGIGLGSTIVEMKEAYGEPQDYLDSDKLNMHNYTYISPGTKVTFSADDNVISWFSLDPGYNTLNYAAKQSWWIITYQNDDERAARQRKIEHDLLEFDKSLKSSKASGAKTYPR